MIAETTQRIGAYIRVSIAEQNIDGQRAEVTKHLTAKGIDPAQVRWFIDEG